MSSILGRKNVRQEFAPSVFFRNAFVEIYIKWLTHKPNRESEVTMNTKRSLTFCIFTLALPLSGFSPMSSADASSPMIQDFDRSELQLRVSPFGEDSPISVGKVLPDGSIHFEWREEDVAITKGSEMFMDSIASSIGMRFCNDKQIVKNDEAAKTVAVKSVSLIKYGKRVGALLPATHKELSDNAGLNRRGSLILGSSISWLYSDRDAIFEAKCIVKRASEGDYSFDEVTSYDLQLKKGWNIVQNTLVEKEDWESANGRGSLPKTKTVTSVAAIPSTISWYMNYWANDELLELERKLIVQTPTTQKAFEDWLPSKLGDLGRQSYTINQKLEDMANENNVQIAFSGGESSIDLTIADSSGSKGAVGIFLMTQDMTRTEWKDELENGYRSSTKIGDARVLVDADSKKNNTAITYNVNDRFIVKAVAENMDLETLWGYLEGLQIDQIK